MRTTLGTALCALLSTLLLACPQAPAEPKAKGDVIFLSPAEHLVRASMALRGLRPSPKELQRVNADADALPDIIDGYLETPEFGATIREMHGEQWLTNVDPVVYPAGFRPLGTLADLDSMELNTSVVESPARYVEHVVMEDRPYHEIVTGDYGYADAVTSTIFGIPYDPAGPQWQETQYDDGRDQAGVLSDSFYFTRHASTFSNKNRGRAAQVSRAFLCYDFLSRHVELDSDIDLGDEEAVQNAVKNNPSCVSCHQSLDPLAASFAPYFPIYVPTQVAGYPFDFYSGSSTNFMRTAEPSFFGMPSSGVRDLGILIASDPRFSMCTARRFSSFLRQVEPEALSIEELSPLNDVFLSTAMSARALVKAIVLSDAFRAKATRSEEGADEVRAVMKARPEQLARLIESLTGYRWKTRLEVDFGTGNIGEIDLMSDALFGFKVLFGGTDGQGVARPSHTMNATASLALRGLAGHAAPFVVLDDFSRARSERHLLTEVDEDTTSESKVRAQLQQIEERLYGASDPDTVDAAYTLFHDALASSDQVSRAWQVTLFAMLQDVRIATY